MNILQILEGICKLLTTTVYTVGLNTTITYTICTKYTVGLYTSVTYTIHYTIYCRFI